jgi:amino acid adenylation domain-containing protein
MEEYDWFNIIPVLVGGCLSVRQQHMTNISTAISDLPPEQRAIRDKCFHPTGKFIEFKKEAIEQSIPSRFEQQVQEYPDRIAVKTREQTLTYDALNKAANRIAHAVSAKRGNREETIGLLLEKDAQLIAAIYGALKAGKIIVPLDPSIPQARLAYMLEDAQAELIVANNRNLSLAEELARGRRPLLNVDEIDSTISKENPGLGLSPNTLAYMLYTSGSTGQPKGVVDNHRNLLHDCMSYTNNLHISTSDRVTLLPSCSFALSVHYLYGALLNGAALYPLDIREEGLAHLATWLKREKITIYQSSVIVFRYFLDTLTGTDDFPDLRLIILGSAQVFRKDIELYKKHFSQACILINALSTTETNTFRWYFIDKGAVITDGVVPVGYAVEDREVLLLDEDGKEVGINSIGEIVVKSPYLSPGYWRRPDLTQAAFLHDSNSREKRVYRTGDLGRFSPDGCLEHIGRKDFQVKIRGFRVEVAEIEAALLEHPNVRESAILAEADNLGDNRLVAFVVVNHQPAPSSSELRSFLKESLPEYMVPSAFVRVSALPLTHSAKVDRRALRELGREELGTKPPLAEPRTPIEENLAKIWSGVLSLDQVGIHDNFFDLGGHSLAATRVISRVINTFKVELPIKSLFESPTVADMAVVIAENIVKKAGEKELARMLAELEYISDEDTRQRLADESK